MKKIIWFLISIAGAIAFSFIALARDESINAIWFIVAAVCIYLIAYRFYAAWIAAKALVIDSSKITPSVRNNDGKDFIPTDKWIVFGHHFAAIAGPGPLVGPTLAAQFGYLPGTIWILVGGVLGGAVQDMSVLFFSIRKNGKSLGQMARDELSKLAGIASQLGTFVIMIILIAVLGLVVVNAMKHRLAHQNLLQVSAFAHLAMSCQKHFRHYQQDNQAVPDLHCLRFHHCHLH